MFTSPYKLILADPPWPYDTWSKAGAGRTAEAHYPTMPVDDIVNLPVKDIASPDAVLLLWATWPNLPAAMRVMAAWGFEYKTLAFLWLKLNQSGAGWFQGLGHYTRANCEPCFLATRRAGLPRLNRDVFQLIIAPRREHSRKPDEQYPKIDRLFGNAGPRIELFARYRRDGWAAAGNAMSGLDISDELANLAAAEAQR